MSSLGEAFSRAKSLAPMLIVVYAVLLGLLSLVAILSSVMDVPVSRFTRDPAAITRVSPFVGVISNIGILFWCSTTAVCFLTAAVHFRKGSATVARFLFAAGLLTLLLLMDDLFMFHERMFPKVLKIPQNLVYVAYIGLILGYFVKFRSVLLRTEFVVLFAACGFLGLSMMADVFLLQRGMQFLYEDGLKLFGIVSWFIYFSKTCFSEIVALTAK